MAEKKREKNEKIDNDRGLSKITIQWFPGHMAKTKRILAENLKLVDIVIEILDARIPFSSKNPDIDKLVLNKPKIVVLNKSDLADTTISRKWEKYFQEKGQKVIFIDSLKGTGIRNLNKAVNELMKEKNERNMQKGRISYVVKSMVVGVPNVGKSAFINKIAGKKIAQTGDRPGVTKSKQWVKLNEKIDLLDTPGILWPKFEDMNVGLNLAFTGAIKDEVYDIIEVSCILLERLNEKYPSLIEKRYKVTDIQGKKGYEILEEIAKKRGCIISGGNIDYERIAAIVLDEFRAGKIGKITLEEPDSFMEA